MKQAWLAVSCGALSLAAAIGQTRSEAPSFEVASVKPAGPDELVDKMPFLRGPAVEQMRFRGGPGSKDPGRIDYQGVTLAMLLRRAYDVKPDQISGPDWLGTERYDIAAKVPPGTTVEQLRFMLQGLLAERFQVRLHRETKTLPVYYLTVAKNGPKLQPAEKVAEYKDDAERKGALQRMALDNLHAMQQHPEFGPFRSFHLAGATMGKFAETLSAQIDHTVEDRTKLDGVYAFSLKWSPEEARPMGDVPLGPSIFAAVEEQLGLKLQRVSEQVEVLVIDKAEKVPTDN